MLVNGDPVDALCCVLHRSLVDRRGRAWVQKLKPMVERQYFEIAIQAAVGKKVIARETVKAYRKDVTAKLYGGDKTRYPSPSQITFSY
jgi:translation elongation factor EF-4